MRLSVKNLSAGYSSFKVSIQELSFEAGSFTGIIGPNGSGKSTFLKTLVGMIDPFRGGVFINSKDLKMMDFRRKARLITYVPAETEVSFPFTVMETVLMGRYPFSRFLRSVSEEDHNAAEEAIYVSGLQGYEKRYYSRLSSGEKQKVLIARSICQGSPIMVLDEPASHLDINHTARIFELLRKLNRKGVTVICVLHDLNAASLYFENLLAMKDGRIEAEGKSEDIITANFLKRLYGESIRVMETYECRAVLPVLEEEN